MNRSRMIAAGTSVGALVAITAGVATANPAPSGASTRVRSVAAHLVPPAPQTPAPTDPSSGSDDQGSTGWQQLPADPTPAPPSTPAPTAPAFDNSNQAPAFDPNADGNLGGSNTRSGGS